MASLGTYSRCFCNNNRSIKHFSRTCSVSDFQLCVSQVGFLSAAKSWFSHTEFGFLAFLVIYLRFLSRAESIKVEINPMVRYNNERMQYMNMMIPQRIS